jgi:hypothetical protein
MRCLEPLRADARVAHLRRCGMIWAFDVRADAELLRRGAKTPAPAAAFAQRYFTAARERGALLRPIGRTVYLMPPIRPDKKTRTNTWRALRSRHWTRRWRISTPARQCSAVAGCAGFPERRRQGLCQWIYCACRPACANARHSTAAHAPRGRRRLASRNFGCGAAGSAAQPAGLLQQRLPGAGGASGRGGGAGPGSAELGAGSGASALISGHNLAHATLEQRFAALQAAHIPSCARCCSAPAISPIWRTIAALADRQTEMFSEELNHASLIDGVRLSRVRAARSTRTPITGALERSWRPAAPRAR